MRALKTHRPYRGILLKGSTKGYYTGSVKGFIYGSIYEGFSRLLWGFGIGDLVVSIGFGGILSISKTGEPKE